MVTEPRSTPRTWTVAEAKAHLSEILRLAEEEGPQRIGVGKTFVVVAEDEWGERSPELRWREQIPEPMPMGQWLVENMPRGIELELPDRRDPPREDLFSDREDE